MLAALQTHPIARSHIMNTEHYCSNYMITQNMLNSAFHFCFHESEIKKPTRQKIINTFLLWLGDDPGESVEQIIHCTQQVLSSPRKFWALLMKVFQLQSFFYKILPLTNKVLVVFILNYPTAASESEI